MKPRSNALLALFLVATPAAAGRLLIATTPSPDYLPGYLTYTLSIETEGSEVFRGVDARFDGPMNQAYPFGNAAIFSDAWAFIPFIFPFPSPAEDSYFLFSSSSVLVIGAEESPNLLKTAASGFADFQPMNPRPFVQIVTDKPTAVNYQLAFDLGGPDPVVFAGFLSVPEPGGLVIAAGFAVALVGRFR